MEIYIPYKDIQKAFECLSNEDLVFSLRNAKLVLEVIDKKLPFQYQLSGGQKGTIVQTRNGRIAHASDPTVLAWEKNAGYLSVIYNIGLLIGSQRNLTIGKSSPVIADFSDVIPAFLNEESYFIKTRQKLLRKNPKFYSKYKWGLPIPN